ncbi:MAG: hypothetical protein KF749_02655 [Bacteroidetes bacterium]|nr:hypothetical protein [Bacteroidota bacterium]MCW5897438.1 hypothetical protein [Bacteroidota bacterium]
MLAGVSFTLGMLVGVYQYPPYAQLRSLRNMLVGESAHSNSVASNNDLLSLAFTDPIGADTLLLPPVSSISAAHNELKKLVIPVELFWDAYAGISLSNESFETLIVGNNKVVGVPYRLSNEERISYAYFEPARRRDLTTAAIVIPGTGINQSTALMQRTQGNYHGHVLDSLVEFCDTYVAVKPNEGFLAIHDGTRKLNYQFIVNYLISEGGSYSSYYLVNAMALTKYLKARYEKVVVVGLSQGGLAALLISLQAHPTAAIVSSGFSIVNYRLTHAGLSQILIPGLYKHYSEDELFSQISKMPTQFMLTYGAEESGLYALEYEKKLTEKKFNQLENIRFLYHDGGHEFPLHGVSDFFREVIE